MTLNVLAQEYTDSSTGTPADMYGQFPKWDIRKTLIKNILQRAIPDVIGLQEDSASQREYLARQLPDYAVQKFSKRQTSTYGGELNSGAIFYKKSKFTYLDSGTFNTMGPRNATWLKAKQRQFGSEWYFINVHFYEGYAESQIEKISQFLTAKFKGDTQDVNLVILGDFNTRPATLSPLLGRLSLQSDAIDKRETFWASDIYVKAITSIDREKSIDHVYSNQRVIDTKATCWYARKEGLSMAEGGAMPYQSDHGAVMVTLQSEHDLRAYREKIALGMTPIVQMILND